MLLIVKLIVAGAIFAGLMAGRDYTIKAVRQTTGNRPSDKPTYTMYD